MEFMEPTKSDLAILKFRSRPILLDNIILFSTRTTDWFGNFCSNKHLSTWVNTLLNRPFIADKYSMAYKKFKN